MRRTVLQKFHNQLFCLAGIGERTAIVRQSADKDTAGGIAEGVACVYADASVPWYVLQQGQRAFETRTVGQTEAVPAQGYDADRFEGVTKFAPAVKEHSYLTI